MNTPLLFLIYNRPEKTKASFEVLSKIHPRQLYIAADGPREGVDKDDLACQQARSVVTKIDWPCDVHKLFRDTNLGCRQAVSSAIDWFFSNVNSGIILEDDCVPDKYFFTFCEALLKKYHDNQRIMHISGNNFLVEKQGDDSYYFSKIPHIWGWATWKRAWKLYDVNMKDYPEFRRNKKIKTIFTHLTDQFFWNRTFANTYAGNINTWDFQWTYTVFKHDGLCINPHKNLVTNIGFDNTATHTGSRSSSKFSLPSRPIKMNHHPKIVEVNESADKYVMKNNFNASWEYVVRQIIWDILGFLSKTKTRVQGRL